MEFEKVISDRFAVRKFSSKKVDEETVKKILEAGRIAPTAKNAQPVVIYAVCSDEGLEKIDKTTPCRYGAQVALVVCGDATRSYQRGNYNSYVIDASIVTTHMMLEATNLGVDTIWVGHFEEEAVVREFELPENEQPICILMLGYKAEDCPANPAHTQRRALEEIVKFK